MDPLSLPPHLALTPELHALLDGMPLEQLAFTPVPVRARHGGWSPDRQRAFILRLALLPNISAAARAVGKSHQSAYVLRARPDAASFARAWDVALTWGEERLMDHAFARALHGETVPITYAGKIVGETRRFDNRLAIAVMRRLDRAQARRSSPDMRLLETLAFFEDVM